MDQTAVFYAKRAISMLAGRDGLTEETVRGCIREAILEAQKASSPQAEPLWQNVSADKTTPSPEKLIVWAAKRILES